MASRKKEHTANTAPTVFEIDPIQVEVPKLLSPQARMSLAMSSASMKEVMGNNVVHDFYNELLAKLTLVSKMLSAKQMFKSCLEYLETFTIDNEKAIIPEVLKCIRGMIKRINDYTDMHQHDVGQRPKIMRLEAKKDDLKFMAQLLIYRQKDIQ